MIKLKDICDVGSKQFSVETREGKTFEVTLFGQPDGINQILAVRRGNGEDVFIVTLPVEVIEAIHEITKQILTTPVTPTIMDPSWKKHSSNTTSP